MTDSHRWRQFWEDKSKANVADFEVDRLRPPGDQEIENLSEQELVNFTAPERLETILDAGCGTGVNILRLHSRARNIIGIDYAWGSLERCQKRIQTHRVTNAHLCLASVTAIPLPDCSVDRVLCLSVLQYMDDEEVRQVLRELVRVLSPGGVIILHVKNSSSLYWSTLRLAKALMGLLRRTNPLCYLRSFRWYAHELRRLNCTVLDYNSFNLLTFERMPKRLLSLLQRCELRYRHTRLLRTPAVRGRGADLKIKAAVAGRGELHGSETPVEVAASTDPRLPTPFCVRSIAVQMGWIGLWRHRLAE